MQLPSDSLAGTRPLRVVFWPALRSGLGTSTFGRGSGVEVSLALPDVPDAGCPALTPFTPFQSNLEAIHGNVHNAVGGDMGTAHSPSDPLFFLHHANIDRLWAKWEHTPKAADPPNPSASLKPRGKIISGKVSAVLDIGRLGYGYS